MSKHKNSVSCELWNDLVIEKQNEISELESDLYNINQIIIDDYLITQKENVEPELLEQYRKVDYELQDAKRGYEYIKLLDKWLDTVKPDKHFRNKMRIFNDLKRSVM